MKLLSLHSVLLVCLSLVSSQSKSAGLLNDASEQVLQALTSKFAIHIYAAVCTQITTHIAQTLLRPALQTYLEKTNSEDPQISQLRLALSQKSVEIDKEIFQYQQEKIKVLNDSFLQYETIQTKNCEILRKSSDLTEEEKQIRIKAIEAKLALTKNQLNGTYTQLYESQISSTAQFAKNHAQFPPNFVR
jgi:hypothetical protein